MTQKEKIKHSVSEVIHHHFSFLLVVRSEILSPAHAQRERGIRLYLLKGEM